MGMKLTAVALGLGLLSSMTSGHATELDADYKVCENAKDRKIQIAACTRLANNQSQMSDLRASAFFNRAGAYGQAGEYDKAIADYSSAIEIKDTPYYYSSRCWAYAQKGDLDCALKDCDKAIAGDASLAEAYVNRGAIYEKKRDAEKAILDYQAALAVEPQEGAEDEQIPGQDEARAALDRLLGKGPGR